MLPRPDDLEEKRPAPAYETLLDLDIPHLEQALPKHLRSYGVWSDKPMKAGEKKRVWRVDRHFGYGPTEPPRKSDIFGKNAARPEHATALTLIDDGGILFRHEATKDAWPNLSAEAKGYFLLKMSLPLCRGICGRPSNR